MKKKIKVGPLKIRVSYKNSRWIKLGIKTINFINPFYKKPKTQSSYIYSAPDPIKLLEIKLYRIFKQEYCSFFPGNKYGPNGTEPSSYVYYINNESETHKKYLIGEFLFGEDKIEFFKRKNILIQETIGNYTIMQGDLLLATYDKEWVEKQGVY